MKAVYIHIPFCKTICSYCDFCKLYYNEEWVDDYLEALNKEIKLNYKNELIETIYIGGGTPSCLNMKQLKRLMDIIAVFKLNTNIEFTFECNIDVTKEQILLLKRYGVNRISIGVQTINEEQLVFLNRKHSKEMVKDKVLEIKQYIDNINLDLMYALESETLSILKEDLSFYLSLDVKHISTYSLMICPHTMVYINGVKPIDEDLDCDMYELIDKTLINYNHYEISNYAYKGYESKHNLTYWNNEHYYGFGLGASGYIGNRRYTNTKAYKDYLNGHFISEEIVLSFNETVENAFILGLRKTEGIKISDFNNKYQFDLLKTDVINILLKEGKLEILDGNIRIKKKYLYISNTILMTFMGVDYEM
ncbi:MAG: radical SAM family heme chaperone HemW [Bacilli bacterium]